MNKQIIPTKKIYFIIFLSIVTIVPRPCSAAAHFYSFIKKIMPRSHKIPVLLHPLIRDNDTLEAINQFVIRNPETVLSQDNQGCEPIYMAAQENRPDVINFLLEKKASVDNKIYEGKFQPIHKAAQKGHANCARLLLTHKADVNAVSTTNITPLHLAAWFNKPDMVEWLIHNNADIKAKNSSHQKAIDVAIEHDAYQAVERLLRIDLDKKTKKMLLVFQQLINSLPCDIIKLISNYVGYANEETISYLKKEIAKKNTPEAGEFIKKIEAMHMTFLEEIKSLTNKVSE